MPILLRMIATGRITKAISFCCRLFILIMAMSGYEALEEVPNNHQRVLSGGPHLKYVRAERAASSGRGWEFLYSKLMIVVKSAIF